MNIVELQVNGKALIFTDESVKYDKYEFLYEKMSDITHRAGNEPRFIFRYGEKRIGIPYELKDEPIIVKMITRIAGILMDKKASVQQQSDHVHQEKSPLIENDIAGKKKEKPQKAPPTKKDTAIGCVSLLVILIIVIFAFSQCGNDDTSESPTDSNGPTISTTETKEYKFNPDRYKNIAYKDLAREPDKYKNDGVTNSGRVVQVIDETDQIYLRVAIDDNNDKIVLLNYKPSIMKKRVLENDYITYYGWSEGLTTYESTLSGSITVPGIFATKINIKE